jgi:hypothetical protein
MLRMREKPGKPEFIPLNLKTAVTLFPTQRALQETTPAEKTVTHPLGDPHIMAPFLFFTALHPHPYLSPADPYPQPLFRKRARGAFCTLPASGESWRKDGARGILFLRPVCGEKVTEGRMRGTAVVNCFF